MQVDSVASCSGLREPLAEKADRWEWLAVFGSPIGRESNSCWANAHKGGTSGMAAASRRGLTTPRSSHCESRRLWVHILRSSGAILGINFRRACSFLTGCRGGLHFFNATLFGELTIRWRTKSASWAGSERVSGMLHLLSPFRDVPWHRMPRNYRAQVGSTSLDQSSGSR